MKPNFRTPLIPTSLGAFHMKTSELSKDSIVARSKEQMQRLIETPDWSVRDKLALTCRILFDGGHDSGLAGQITARGTEPHTFYTQRLGLGFGLARSRRLCGPGRPGPRGAARLVGRGLGARRPAGFPAPARAL